MEFPANSIRRARPARDERKLARELLRAAFPGARGGELVERAARYTGRCPKTIQNWLDGTHDMKLEEAAGLVPLIAVERVLQLLYPSKD